VGPPGRRTKCQHLSSSRRSSRIPSKKVGKGGEGEGKYPPLTYRKIRKKEKTGSVSEKIASRLLWMMAEGKSKKGGVSVSGNDGVRKTNWMIGYWKEKVGTPPLRRSVKGVVSVGTKTLQRKTGGSQGKERAFCHYLSVWAR